MNTNRRRETPALAEAFERLVRSHRSEIFRTVFRLSRNREDAEDLTQITFLNAYAALQRGAQPEAPRAWLHAIARNAGSRRFRQRRIVEVELDEETSGPDVDDVLTIAELQTALAQLTLNQRAALLMREVGGLSAREIAARLGISPGAVATLLFRARRALRAELEGTPQGRPLFGGIAVLATALRSAWLRLLGPIGEGSELLARSGTVAGVAAATAGVAFLTTSAVPLPARADHSGAVAAPHATAAITVSRAPRVRVAKVAVALPVQVRGTTHVTAAVTASQPHHAQAVATARRVSPPHTTAIVSAPATESAPDRAAAAAPAGAGSEGSAPSPRAATLDNSAPAAQPAVQALVTSATQSLTQVATQAVTQAVPATTPVTSAVPSAPVPALPAVTTPAVTTPAVTTPAVTTPVVITPTVTTPVVTTPTVTTPAVTTPTVTTPTVTTPTVEPPALPPPPPGILPSG